MPAGSGRETACGRGWRAVNWIAWWKNPMWIRAWPLLALLLGVPVQAQPIHETAAEGRNGSNLTKSPSPASGGGGGGRGPSPTQPGAGGGGGGGGAPSPTGRGSEGEGETARFMSTNRGNNATGRSLPRENPVPGGIVILPVAPDTEPAPVARYDNQRVMVVP